MHRRLARSASAGWLTALLAIASAPAPASAAPLRLLPDGQVADPLQFPIGVYLQDPSQARAWQAVGVNVFVGLWRGPTAGQLAALAAAGMPAIAAPAPDASTPDASTLPHADQLIGWLQDDEADNAQPLPGGGYGPCVPADEIRAHTRQRRAADPTRPVMVVLGQGVADRTWQGRGRQCFGDWDYYKRAMQGAQIPSFDIYPATETRPAVAGRLDLVAQGMQNLVRWGDGPQQPWMIVGTTRLQNPDRRTTPAEIRAQVWMAIIHGARGIVYFVHDLKPTLNATALLTYPDSVAEVTRTNALIQMLAPVLNAPPPDRSLATAQAPFALMQRQAGGALYVFAVNMQPDPAELALTLDGVPGPAHEMTGDRDVPVAGTTLHDPLPGWGTAIYRLPLPGPGR